MAGSLDDKMIIKYGHPEDKFTILPMADYISHLDKFYSSIDEELKKMDIRKNNLLQLNKAILLGDALSTKGNVQAQERMYYLYIMGACNDPKILYTLGQKARD